MGDLRMMMMSVELAIQRELAYRAKLVKLPCHDASFFKEFIPLDLNLEGTSSTTSTSPCPPLSEMTRKAPKNDLKLLSPSQAHEIENQIGHTSFEVQPTSATPNPSPSPRPYSSPGPTLSGTKKQASTNSIKFLPPPQLNEHECSMDYAFCKVQSSSSSNPKSRENSSPLLSGVKQQPPTNCFEFTSPHELGNQIDTCFCKVCKVTCSGFVNYKQHTKGRKHQGKLQELILGKKDCGELCVVPKQRQWCGFCKIWCIDEVALRAHFGGRKHRGEVAKLELAEIGGGGSEIANCKHWCQLCNIWCIDKDSLHRHNEGKRHVLRLHEIEKKKASLGGNKPMEYDLRCLCLVYR